MLAAGFDEWSSRTLSPQRHAKEGESGLKDVSGKHMQDLHATLALTGRPKQSNLSTLVLDLGAASRTNYILCCRRVGDSEETITNAILNYLILSSGMVAVCADKLNRLGYLTSHLRHTPSHD